MRTTYNHGAHGFLHTSLHELEGGVLVPYGFEVKKGTSKVFLDEGKGTTVSERSMAWIVFR